MNQRSLSAIVLGLLFISLPRTIGLVPIEVSFPLVAKLLVIFYGLLMIVAGIYVKKAERYKFLLDIYSVLGVFIMLAGPVTNFPLGAEFWSTITAVTAIFLGLPTVLLLKLNR